MEKFSKANAIGFVNFDTTGGSNIEVEIRVPFDKLLQLARGKYVIIEAQGDDYYLARITKGPFYTPDAVSRDSAFAKASIVQAETISFIPDYHGICFVELIGIFDINSTQVSGIQTRPRPKSAVYPLPSEKLEDLLRIQGNMYLGQVSGYHDIRVRFNSNKKTVLPRNLGIFGTVGSGKTNSSQVLIEEASAAGWAVIVIDVEGEYISMDEPSGEISKDSRIRKKASDFKIEAKGLDKFQVFIPTGSDTKSKKAYEFSIPFGGLSPYELSEIMGMNDTQLDRFIELWDEQKEKINKGAASSSKRKYKNQWEAIDKGVDDELDLPGLTIKDLIETLNSRLLQEKGSSKASWLVVKRLLNRLKRFGIFDVTDDLLNPGDFLKAGKVSVLDMSNTYNVQVNNIVIAYILRKVFDMKVKEENLPPTMIFIEEAHTFVSKENASKMEALMDRLREVTRRGRKRWLGLCFISQQPSHLPDEIYELCNTKIIHQTIGNRNINSLKISAGNVNEAIWDEVPTLGQGRSIIISPQFQHPIMTNMRPCKTNREYTE
ncbi:MAG: ATP-binding protein [Ignavibacteria bacterium]|nr:ATP-binding protein [Ignavibacteria bacterium]